MSLIVIDVEADGPCPGLGSMVCFGAVLVKDMSKTFYGKVFPITNKYEEEALSISGFSRKEHETFDDPRVVMSRFAQWIKEVNESGRPIMISDNCLKYSTRIIVTKEFSFLKSYKERNKTVEIFDIVKNKVDLPLPSYNFNTKEIELKKIINWYDNEPEKEWVKIENELNNRSYASYTKSHLIYIKNKGWEKAEKLNIDDELLQIDIHPNDEQYQILLGSIIGDASFGRNDKRGRTCIIAHANRAYTEYKYNLLKGLIKENFIIKEKINNRGFSKKDGKLFSFFTKTLRCFKDINKNDILLFDKLNYIGLAFWYMDDGSISKYQTKNGEKSYARFHIEGIKKEYVLKIIDILNKKTNLNWKQTTGKNGGSVLYLSIYDSEVFFKKIAKYVDKSMSYKLPNKFQILCNSYIFESKILYKTFESKVTNIEIIENKENRKYRANNYCIDVEDNHNFFTTMGLVHNCAFDWQWINYYFHNFNDGNPMGFSARRIGDLYCGMVKDGSKNREWKRKFRKTKHTHNPVDDAKGNAEAIHAMIDRGLKIHL